MKLWSGLVLDAVMWILTSKGIRALWDVRQGKEVMWFITFRKTSLMAAWRADCSSWGWGSRVDFGRLGGQLYKEMAAYEGLN